MNTFEFRWLMRGIDLLKPSKRLLWNVLDRQLSLIDPTRFERSFARKGFEITFRGHEHAPLRASGEAYVFHPVRSAIQMIWLLNALKIKDIRLIIVILLHDCFEDAEKAGVSPLLMRSQVHMRMGDEIAYDVHCLTKQKHLGETNYEYLVRLLKAGQWRPLAAKLDEREDNVVTLESMSPGQQVAKLEETEMWLPLIASQLVELIDREIRAGVLATDFKKLPPLICKKLVASLQKERGRLSRAK